MPKNVELLLTENVESLGIVGDVVSVRTGYARNYLLPRSLATRPSEEAMQALAARRSEAEKQLRELRAQREAMIARLAAHEVHITRSCNDQGLLYGSVTQKDVADALVADGFNIKPRDVRVSQVIKRIDTYHVLIKLDTDLDAEIKLWIVPDRELPKQARDEEPAPAAPQDAGAEAGEGGGKKPHRARPVEEVEAIGPASAEKRGAEDKNRARQPRGSSPRGATERSHG